MPMPEDWLVPDWPSPARVRAVFTTRSGGVSAPPFDRLNLGDHVRDDPVAVATNRAHLAGAIGARPVFLTQVHGTTVASLDARTPDGGEADACITSQPGVACTIMVADCLPVLFTNSAGTVVAAAHAGWRGLAGGGEGPGVLEATWEAFADTVQREDPTASRDRVAAETLAWLGPCIGPQAFEVGPEVRNAFVSLHGGAQACFAAVSDTGKYLADLPALARLRLQAMGITAVHGNDGSLPWCTVAQASRFFSHRRDAVHLGSTGRMAACIWLV
jgi:YfiH family protein